MRILNVMSATGAQRMNKTAYETATDVSLEIDRLRINTDNVNDNGTINYFATQIRRTEMQLLTRLLAEGGRVSTPAQYRTTGRYNRNR